MASGNTESFNTDELEAPQWLNTAFFEKVLRDSEHDAQLQVLNMKLSPGTVKGDHYASVMFRNVVNYQQKGAMKTKSLILKTMPEVDGHKKDFLKESYIFETEIGMYMKVLPRFEQILRSVGDDTVLHAECIYHSLQPKKVMIFEDLVPKGYTVLRGRQVTKEEAKLALSKLAKWHAVSFKCIKENPSYFDEYKHGLFTMASIKDNAFMSEGVARFVKCLDEVPALTKYKPYFESLKETILEQCVATFEEYRRQPIESAYYVLCHGDFHSKNMMFKHEPATGKAQDVMLLDFQLSYVGPIANDLIYAFFMLLDTDMRLNKFDEMLYFYFRVLTETLTKIGYGGSMPKLTELRAQFMRHKSFELFLMVTFLPVMYEFRQGEMDVDKVMTSEDYCMDFYRGKEFLTDIHKLLPQYLHRGYFEN